MTRLVPTAIACSSTPTKGPTTCRRTCARSSRRRPHRSGDPRRARPRHLAGHLSLGAPPPRLVPARHRHGAGEAGDMSTRVTQLVLALVAVLAASAASTACGPGSRPIALPTRRAASSSACPIRPTRQPAPFDKTFVAPRAQIDEDSAGSRRRRMVRTYSSRQGSMPSPTSPRTRPRRAARHLLARERRTMPRRSRPGYVPCRPTRARAGDRGRQRDPAAARADRRAADRRDRQGPCAHPPALTYADVWEFWLKASRVAAHVDFVTVHISLLGGRPRLDRRQPRALQDVLDKVKAAFPASRS